MKLISHRGNINGKIEKFENNPNYIDAAIEQDYDVDDIVNLFLHHNLVQ